MIVRLRLKRAVAAPPRVPLDTPTAGRVQVRPRPPVPPVPPEQRQFVQRFTGLVILPLSGIALALTGWRLGADLGVFGPFVFSSGVLSHWQAWFGIAALLHSLAFLLYRRFGGGDDEPAAS